MKSNESEHKRRKRERGTSTHNLDNGDNESDFEGSSDESGNNNINNNGNVVSNKLGTSRLSRSNSASASVTSANKSRNKPGWKRTDVPADDKRTAQNSNDNSNNDDNNNGLYTQMFSNSKLNNVVLPPLLKSTPSAISSESPFLSDESHDPAHDNAFTPASELFGPIYVDAYRTVLKQVSSISKCLHVDEMMDFLLSQALCKDEAEREEKFLCVMAIQGQFQALCNTEGDRTKMAVINDKNLLLFDLKSGKMRQMNQPTAKTRTQLAEFLASNSNSTNNTNNNSESTADIQRTISFDLRMTDSADVTMDNNAAGSTDNDNDDTESKKQQRINTRSSDVSNKRKSQVRQRQQNHTLELERKTSELERKVAELSAIIQQYQTQNVNNSITNKICSNAECSTKLANMIARNQALERQISKIHHFQTERRLLHQQPSGQQLLPTQHDPNRCLPFDIIVPSFSSLSHTNAAVINGGRDCAAPSVGRSNRIADLIETDEIAASADLFGRLEIETFRVQLNALLRGIGTREVNELIDSALDSSVCKNRVLLKRLVTKSMMIKRNLLDQCDEIDRPHAIAIIEGMKETENNMMHWNHWYQSIAATVNLDVIPEINSLLFSNEMREILQKTIALQETVRDNILSLSGHAHLVRALLVACAKMRKSKMTDLGMPWPFKDFYKGYFIVALEHMREVARIYID
ncbi:hypothetical protein HK100_001226 [Physocladia obscura]|uniref:Uncharacterized protein n=1 Tax=Physocladia obscura TaxID=109957 RepID=A0AAD5XGB4_9FUNG|nr:hypothetical protein HK100_001226 [Physocladia obscura]